MSRQHAAPVILKEGSTTILSQLSLAATQGGVSEAHIQELVHKHPESLPIEEIDPSFKGPVAICRELMTPAGPIDNLLVTPSGLPILVECKLWRNPEGRREVVGQIIDYAKELSRWTSSDLQREVSRRLGIPGNAMLDLVRAVDPSVDEIAFNDALSLHLRRGRFLLLIVGDGIREGVEAIAEYLQRHAGLHFSMGLVEMPIFSLPEGGLLITPRVLARTASIERTVISVPDGHRVVDGDDTTSEKGDDLDPDREATGSERLQFWTEFLQHLRVDDPEQALPKPSRTGYISIMLPAPNGSSWLTVYREKAKNSLGIFLSASRNSVGEFAMQSIVDAWHEIKSDLGGTATILDRSGRKTVSDSRSFASLNTSEGRTEAFSWLAERVNTFVNVVRPRVRSAVIDYGERGH
ncbi:DUF4268 domain-containing protein [Neorhizobium galegae]|uniref:DUF4268 domain-containing protein n=1 Tax=Neorhizobium galegae TaxID=399 RepID=UPI0006210256|nr:DUF4268 domain-containing protein [Neorhizobium galegae]CDZ55438.1 Hypothetical protein NGAL_HAMBI2427_62230 [Neorhizobium galegae bv. orientalis]